MVVTREDAVAEVEQRRISDPDATWFVTKRGEEWSVARLGVKPTKATGTATKPPPEPQLTDPFTPIERAAWLAGTGG